MHPLHLNSQMNYADKSGQVYKFAYRPFRRSSQETGSQDVTLVARYNDFWVLQ